MATLSDIRPSITDMDREDVLQMILMIRESRQTRKAGFARKKAKPKVKKVESLSKMVDKMSDADKLAMLKELEESL